MIIKIQSISDVVTNSSTEVYIRYYQCDKDAIINLVNAILAINGNGKFEDYFNFEWVSNEDLLYCKWQDREIEISFEEWIKTLSEDDLFDEYESWNSILNFVEGYVITAKNPNNEQAAQLLSTLDTIFTTEVYE